MAVQVAMLFIAPQTHSWGPKHTRGATNTLVGQGPFSVTQESNGLSCRMLLKSELVRLLFLSYFEIYSSEFSFVVPDAEL